MTFIQFIKQIITSHSGISSKRICGVLGWFVCLGVLIYCSILSIQAPLMIDTVLLCCMGLLGIDSVTGIWKKFDNSENKHCNYKDSSRYETDKDCKNNVDKLY